MSKTRQTADVFTRFTAQTPHATSRAAAAISQPPPNTSSSTTSRAPPLSSRAPPGIPTAPPPRFSAAAPPPPPNETPQEKVARLRAAHRLKMARANMSTLDRVIASGRNVADGIHRFSVFTLIGFAGLCALTAAYATFDLVTYTRRQKRAWVEREMDRLDEARRAFLRGDADAEQLHILELERAGDEMLELAKRDKERKRRESWWEKGKAVVGLQSIQEEEVVKKVVSQEIAAVGVGEDAARYGAVGKARENVDLVLENKQVQVPLPGGPLDGAARQVTSSIAGGVSGKSGKSGWFSWGRDRDHS